jgi:hypothetical protein
VAYTATHRKRGVHSLPGTRTRSAAALLLAAVALHPPARAADPAAPPAPAEYGERGVYYIEGAVRSPIDNIGERSEYAANRLALDDDRSRVVVDRARNRIVVHKAHRYGLRELVGCLLLIGRGTTESGRDVPAAVHLRIHKSGNRFSSSLHPHPTVREKLVRATFTPFEVVLDNGVKQKVALTAEQTVEAVRDPELTARLASIAIQVTDHLEGVMPSPERPNEPLVDIAIGFGSERVNLKLVRVRLLSKSADNAPMIRRGSIDEMIERGDWEFLVDSQSPYVPRSEFQRSFFLFGIDDLPATQKFARRGLLYSESLSVGLKDGVGYIAADGERSEIPNPAEVARAYLEFHFVGGMVAQRVVEIGERFAAMRAE